MASGPTPTKPSALREAGARFAGELEQALQREDASGEAEGHLSLFLQIRGFSLRAAGYVTDTWAMYKYADLQYPSLEDIKQLDEIEGWQKDLLIGFCNVARRHYGMQSLEQEEHERLAAARAEHAARRATYIAHNSITGSTSANQYLVGLH